MASRFLEGLLSRQRYSKHQALRVLGLLRTWRRDDVLAAMERAVRYHAYSLSSLERILAVQARPRAPWEMLPEEQQQLLRDLAQGDPLTPRSSREYQGLLFGEEAADDEASEGETPPNPLHDNPNPEPDHPDEPPTQS